MKKILAKDLNLSDVGQTVFLDEECRWFAKVKSIFLTPDQVLVVTDKHEVPLNLLILGPEDFVRFAEASDFVLVGVAQ